MLHAHTWSLTNSALRRYRCSCGVVGYAPANRRRVIIPYQCQREDDERKHCGAAAVVVGALRTQSRCKEHAVAAINQQGIQ